MARRWELRASDAAQVVGLPQAGRCSLPRLFFAVEVPGPPTRERDEEDQDLSVMATRKATTCQAFAEAYHIRFCNLTIMAQIWLGEAYFVNPYISLFICGKIPTYPNFSAGERAILRTPLRVSDF